MSNYRPIPIGRSPINPDYDVSFQPSGHVNPGFSIEPNYPTGYSQSYDGRQFFHDPSTPQTHPMNWSPSPGGQFFHDPSTPQTHPMNWSPSPGGQFFHDPSTPQTHSVNWSPSPRNRFPDNTFDENEGRMFTKLDRRHAGIKRKLTYKEMINMQIENNYDVTPGDLVGILGQYIEEEKKLSKFQFWKKERKQKWNHFKADVRNSMKTWGLWSNSIKAIKGEYGNAMVSFFHFLRWLVILNFLLMLIMLCVITFPFISSSKHLNFSFYLENSGEKWITNNSYVLNAEKCSKNYSDFTVEELKKRKVHEHIKDTLQGTGFMENTVLFYGSYHNITIADNNYNMSLAYILATLAFFFVSFIAIIVSIAKGIKESLINQLSTGVPFTQKVFASWDFCMKNDNIVRWKKTCLLQELRADLATQRELWEKSNRTFKTKVRLYSTRFLLNIIVLCILLGSLALIYYSSDFLLTLQKETFENTFQELLIQFLPSLIISLLNVFVPIIFNFLIQYEGYTSSFEVKLKLLRIVLLRLASVAILLFSLYGKLNQTPGKSTCNFKNQEKIKCWETYVGQQFYKLIILDFAIVIFVNMVIHTLRRLVYNYFHHKEDDQLDSNVEDREVVNNNNSNAGKKYFARFIQFVGPQEFILPQNVLDIVYLQSLCWLGTFFSPLSPVIITVHLFIIFYVKKFTLTYNCVQAARPFRSSKSNSLFMFAVLLSFTLCILPISFVIGSIEPSKGCGPFRVYSEEEFSMFTTLSNLVNSWPDIIAKILNLIFTPAIMVPIIIIICFFIYYNFIVIKGCIRMEDLLREQLVLDGKDKRFLLNKLKKYKTISKL